jgi:aquaporin Z
MPLSRRLGAEFIGTFWLVLAGCGSAVLAAAFPDVGIGLLGVSLAFGLSVLTMAYAFGHISGGHFNPAVTVGLWLGRRLPARNGRPGYRLSVDGLAANGYGAHSPGKYALGAALLTEIVLTLVFLLVILGATDRRAPKGMGPLAIGLVLTLIHLMSIPVTNTSVNPARSTGPALFVGGWALSQLWLFWLAPLVGAAIAGYAYRYIVGDDGSEPIATEAQDSGRAEMSAGDIGRPTRPRTKRNRPGSR